jgi:hypothetical protein
MNAVATWAPALGRPTLRRLAGGGGGDLARAVIDGYGLDLAGFLNALRRAELDAVAEVAAIDPGGSVGQLRARLWIAGAVLEAGSRDQLGTPVQPVPVVLAERLRYQGREPGLAPPSPRWPRPIPPVAPTPRPESEPADLESLLDAADALIGVRLGERGRDKGAHGTRVESLLGVAGDGGDSVPDWRGEVEIKTVPVFRDRSGLWRVKEDPAVSMEGADPAAKLERVLWIARVADDPRSPILSWYYQERDAAIAGLYARDLHTRPKGGAGATTRGWYLHKRFFLDSGFLASLNG